MCVCVCVCMRACVCVCVCACMNLRCRSVPPASCRPRIAPSAERRCAAAPEPRPQASPACSDTNHSSHTHGTSLKQLTNHTQRHCQNYVWIHASSQHHKMKKLHYIFIFIYIQFTFLYYYKNMYYLFKYLNKEHFVLL